MGKGRKGRGMGKEGEGKERETDHLVPPNFSTVVAPMERSVFMTATSVKSGVAPGFQNWGPTTKAAFIPIPNLYYMLFSPTPGPSPNSYFSLQMATQCALVNVVIHRLYSRPIITIVFVRIGS